MADTDVIHTGDCLKVMAEMPAESVHAVVTDPPYGLAFMGRDWDDFEPKEYQEWCEEWATEAKRVLKPGGHLLAFSGNRTHHRLFSGVEDAGFEIRDTLTWHYGSGFPKALDVSKAIDKQKDKQPLHEFRNRLEQYRARVGISRSEIADQFGVDSRLVYMWMGEGHDPQVTSPTEQQWAELRELLDAQELDGEWNAIRERVGKPSVDFERRDVVGKGDAGLANGHSRETGAHDVGYNNEYDITAPATDAAERWDGWKTALKPATEFVVMARKPFDGTVAECVQAHGTAALNVDGCRVEGGERPERVETHDTDRPNTYNDPDGGSKATGTTCEGRYPANVVFDEAAAEALDREVGDLDAGAHTTVERNDSVNTYGDQVRDAPDERTPTDTGGPSRYFYTSKATRAERTLDGTIENAHPTVKPQDLMEWLVRLVTAEEQIVLDPFAGSGTTLAAAKDLGREFVGVEMQAKWADVARVRCGLTPDDPSIVRGDDNQQGLEAYD